MARKLNSSRQTESLLSALLADPPQWRHGYDVSRETGLQSGTLYPILRRLEAQGWLESRWQEEPASGRPARHLYRLTSFGVTEGNALLKVALELGRTPGLKPAEEVG